MNEYEYENKHICYVVGVYNLKPGSKLPNVTSRGELGTPSNGKFMVDSVGCLIPLSSFEDTSPPHGGI